MKARTSFLKRCLALALALLMLVSSSNMGIALQAFAAGNSVSYGELVADNYDDLTAAEKDLLNSGYLAGGSYEYASLGDGLVQVDTDNKKITAANSGDWVPTNAYIVVGEETKETIDISSGECSYTYTGNAFSVKVDYVLNTTVDAALQETLLKTAGWLKAGVANVDKLVAEGGALSTLELAMPQLVNLADNGYTVFGNTVNLVAEVKNAIYSLNDQLSANGHLNLVIMQEAYSAGKTKYLLNDGMALKAELETTRENVNWIHKNLGDIQNIVGSLGEQYVDADTVGLIKMLHGILGNWITAADKAIAGDWTAAEKGTALVSGSVKYADLDAKVAALGDISTVTVKNPLKVADTSVTVNLDMYDVTVEVVLKTTQDNEVKVHDTVTGKVTLAKNATAEEIAAAAESIIDGALAGWDAYKKDHFKSSTSTLPETLTEDITYTITYTPKNYTLTLGYGDAMTVPYGYKYTLPKHTDEAKAYDYLVNGNKMAQGETYTVKGDAEITRTAGKAYTVTDLYAAIANNYGNDVAKAILTSGALKGNEKISVRKPDPADASDLIKLVDGELVILDGKYDAAYEGNKWVPYTYGANGTENTFGANPEKVAWSGDSVKVQYILTLANFSADEVKDILDLAVTLKEEAAKQKSTLDALATKYDVMGQLDKTKLGALNGVIDVTDFTEGDGTDTDAKNLELRAYFKGLVSGIIANNLDANNYLKIYNILGSYKDANAGGLTYYYANSEAVINEIDSLSGYLTGLLADDEKKAALEIMVTAAGYPEYAEKIENLEGTLATAKANLTAPNAKIDLTSDKLSNLIKALEGKNAASYSEYGSPFMVSAALTAMDQSKVMIQVLVDGVEAETKTITTAALENGHVVTAAEVEELKSQVKAYAADKLGDSEVKHYNVSGMSDLDALVGQTLTGTKNVNLTYSVKEYTVTIEGVGDTTITVKSSQITLPGHETADWAYAYKIPFETEEIEVVNGESKPYSVAVKNLQSFTVTRREYNKTVSDFKETLGDLKTIDEVTDADGNITGILAHAKSDDLMAFATELTSLGYNYIELNDRVLLHFNESDSLEIIMQTLIDAVLEDNGFGSKRLIELGTNGKGVMFNGKIDIGNSADDIKFSDLDFTFELDSVPGKMQTLTNGLTKVEKYMSFNSKDGVMEINLNLPEKIYEAYLTALLAAGEVDKTDINAIEEEIAMQFLYDYIELIVATDATTTTYTNTLAKLGVSYDLAGAEDYYQMVKKFLTHKGVKVNTDAPGFDVAVTAGGKGAIDALLPLLGVDPTSVGTYTSMIKEYNGGSLNVNAVASLKNVPSKYEALVLDLDAAGAKNKFDYTNDLPERAKTIAGQAVVILLGNVDGNLKFPAATILDLNGFKVEGNVSSAGKLYIVDSRLETKSGAEVTGSVSANAVFGGKYSSLDASALKDGFVQTDGYVHNALYTIKAKSGTYTFSVNTDVMEDVGTYTDFAKAVAVEMAVDLALNYFTAASLSVEGNSIYAANFDKILGMLEGGSTVDTAITQTLACINAAGITDAANMILADLVDFEAISGALKADETVATYALSTSPWEVTVEHITDGDYIDIGLTATSDASLAKNEKIAIKFVGDNVAPLADLTGEIAKVASALVTVKLEQPTYADKKVTVSGSTEATAIVDVSKDAANTDNYGIMVSVILAYGNPAKRAAVAEAVNNNDMNALKAIFDDTTVAEIFTALKKLSRTTDFAAMAEAVGVTADVSGAADLEAIYHLSLCAAGKALEKAGVTGRDSKMGGLYNDATGFYELTKENVFKDKEVSRKGYTALAELTLTKLNLQLKLFTECMWGDVNHDDKVNTYDATLIVAEYLGNASEDIKCLLRADVNCDGKINTYDATLVVAYYLGNIDTLPYLEETT